MKSIENNDYLALMQIITLDFAVPEVIIELENLFFDLEERAVFSGGLISDSYLQQTGVISKLRSKNLDIFLDLGVSADKIKDKLNQINEVSNLTKIKKEKVSSFSADYTEQLVNKRISFTYKGYNCNLLFCINSRTRIWDFDLTFRQFMYFDKNLYATEYAIKDINNKVLRVLNPSNSIQTLQRIIIFQQEYGFRVNKESLDLLIDYIKWFKEEDSLLEEVDDEQVFNDHLREYYYRLISQKKAHGRSLLTYLLLSKQYKNDYFSNLIGTYRVKYGSNLNYKRFMKKAKDLQFKVETGIKDKKEEVIHKTGSKELSTFINSDNCKRVVSLLEGISKVSFEEFLSALISDDKIKFFYKWHSPKLGKTLINLKDFIKNLEFVYYKNHILNLCDQLLKLFNTRGPDNAEFKVTISQDAVDLLAISTDKNWTSCLELPEPDNQRINAARVAANVQSNTLVAYITSLDNEEWLGRVLIRLLQNGKLQFEKYYGEPVLKEILSNKLKEIINKRGYQSGRVGEGLSCKFIEWKPYSDRGKIKKLKEDIHPEYYVDYSLNSIIKNKFTKNKFKNIKIMESDNYGKAGLFGSPWDIY
jgi:hypothetical protein